MAQLHVLAMSDSDYVDLIAEGYLDDRCIMIVSQERGPGLFDVEFLCGFESEQMRVACDDVIALVQLACDKLRHLKRTSTGGQGQAPG